MKISPSVLGNIYVSIFKYAWGDFNLYHKEIKLTLQSKLTLLILVFH